MKTGRTPLTCPFYNDKDEILRTRDIVELPEVCDVGLNEDDRINLSRSITKDTENSTNIFLADNKR